MKKLFLVDAYALIFKYYYAFIGRPMRSPSGMNTSVVFGFTKFLRDILAREKPDLLGVAFDPKGGCTFRKEMLPEYKANRLETPEDIILSVPYIKRLLEAMCIPILEVEGYEADDVIGTLAHKASAAGYDVYMVTPDKDYGQLVGEHRRIYRQKGDRIEIVDREAIREKYGIDDPVLVRDILALWGDASDNIPGVPGIGEKSACKLVQQWGTVENMLDRAAEIKGRQGERIAAWGDRLRLAKALTSIRLDAPIEFRPEDLSVCAPHIDALKALFGELGFKAFWADPANVAPPEPLPDRPVQAAQTQLAEMARAKSAAARKARLKDQGDLFADQPAAEPEPVHAAAATPISQTLPFDTAATSATAGTSATATPQAPASAAGAEAFGIPEAAEPAMATALTTPHTYHLVEREEELEALVGRLRQEPLVCFDTETSGLDLFRDHIVGVSFAIRPFEAWYVALNRQNTARFAGILRPLFEDEGIDKAGQNLKFDCMVLQRIGIEVRGRLIDTMILHYLLDPESRHNMDALAERYLNYRPIAIETLIGKGAKQLSMEQVAVARVAEYAAEDADVTLRLKEVLYPMVQEAGLAELYFRIEEPMIRVLAAMETTGVKIDTATLDDYARVLNLKLAELESEIRAMAGEPNLNINSSRQLGELLFGKMRIAEKPKMTRTKQFSTEEEYLQTFARKHPIVDRILEYRGVKKLLSTYVEALPQLVNPVTGRIHTSYNQAVTATGRLSSTNPNLQNIPIRDELGRPIRAAFIPSSPDRLLLSVDYSQVELRLMAHLSGDESLLHAFAAGEDIHTATAARLFDKTPEEVLPEERRRAKTANFGIIYGISAFGLAQRLEIPRAEARALIDDYFRSYPGVRAYMERVVAEARENRFVSTIFGRRRYLNDIASQNAVARGLAERNAINAPIQGSAADIMKLAMIGIARRFRQEQIRSTMIMQVHDEVVIDLLPEEQPRVIRIVTEEMEGAALLKVRLQADAGTGRNWLEAH